jgi:arabinose-5-phosphate isomerase
MVNDLRSPGPGAIGLRDMTRSDPIAPKNWHLSATRALDIELAGLTAMRAAMDNGLGASLARAAETIARSKGKVIVSGMGKSGHIARKIASTLASTGTPAVFVHPAEASHGDLGMITPDDVVIMLSNSGESSELRDMLAYTRRFKVTLIAITAFETSTLGREADLVLAIPQAQEACPNGLAPTTSTLMQLALGDALAIALLEDKGFSARDFRNYHPGGKLGAQLKLARDLMHMGEALPLTRGDAPMSETLVIMTAKSFGCAGVLDAAGMLSGIVTDGDLRRNMRDGLLHANTADVMTTPPKAITGDMLAGEVLEFLNSSKITSVFVVDDAQKPIGLIHIHDLLRIGVS